MDREDEDDICIRAPRDRSSDARGASRRGGLVWSWPGTWRTKSSIQLTDWTRISTCQKQVTTPRRKTAVMNPLNSGLTRRMPTTSAWMNHAPLPTSRQATSMATICRIG